MAKHIVTKEDLKKNPELKKQGIKEGDEIDIPDNEQQNNDGPQNDDGDTGGSNPPPSKGRG